MYPASGQVTLVQIIQGVSLLTGAADPSAGGGVAATAPALYLRTGTEQLWLKTGAADTDWTLMDAAGADITAESVTATDPQAFIASTAPGAFAAAPTIALGDGDSGFYESADDTIKAATAGVDRVTIAAAGLTSAAALVATTDASGATVTATTTLKVTRAAGAHQAAPDIALGDLDTGLWESADDVLKIGTAGVERVSIDAAAGVVVAAALPVTFQGMTWRKVASGTTACPNGAATVLTTQTRNAGEVFKLFAFPKANDVLIVFSEGQGGSVYHRMNRTVNANEFTIDVVNISTVNTDVDWVLMAVV